MGSIGCGSHRPAACSTRRSISTKRSTRSRSSSRGWRSRTEAGRSCRAQQALGPAAEDRGTRGRARRAPKPHDISHAYHDNGRRTASRPRCAIQHGVERQSFPTRRTPANRLRLPISRPRRSASFPQTSEVREARAKFRTGKIDVAEYDAASRRDRARRQRTGEDRARRARARRSRAQRHGRVLRRATPRLRLYRTAGCRAMAPAT